MEGTIFAKDKPSNEENSCPRETGTDPPRAAFDVILPEMVQTREQEKDGERSRHTLSWKIDVVSFYHLV